MRSFFHVLTVISAALMIIFILAQSGGSSLGEAFGGDNTFYRSRRGVELVVYQLTIFFAVVFVVSVLLSILAR